MNITEIVEWVEWRLSEAREDRKRDLAAMAGGGAGFEEGRREGFEQAFEDVYDMLTQALTDYRE